MEKSIVIYFINGEIATGVLDEDTYKEFKEFLEKGVTWINFQGDYINLSNVYKIQATDY